MASFRAFFRRFQIDYLLDVLKAAFRRFPLVCLCCLAGTALGLLAAHDVKLFADDTMARLALFLAYGTVGFLAAALFAESRKLQDKTQIALNLLLGAALAGFAALPEFFTASHMFFGAALALLLLVAPYAGRQSSEDSFWYFNYSGFVGGVIAGISTLILCGGLAAILGSVDYLFELSVPGRYYGDIWIIGGGFFGPLLFLSYVPRQFDFAPEECRMMPGIFFIANYIVVPLVLIMTWVLYAYFAKIVLKWELPRGGLAYMVTGFGAAGTAARLAIFPMRENGTKLLQQFYNYFYHLLPVPLVLLGFGLYTRLSQYGVTEERYAIAISFLWLTVTTLFALVRPRRMHLKYIPMLLAALFLLASLGPWGAVPVSTQSQLARLDGLLEKNGMLKNGAVVKAARQPPFKDRQEMSSILDYLVVDHRIAALRPLVAPFEKEMAAQDNNALVDTDCTRHFTGCYNPVLQPEKIMTAWNITYVESYRRDEKAEDTENFTIRQQNYNYYGDTMLKVAPYTYLARVNVSTQGAEWRADQVYNVGGKPAVKVKFGFTHTGVFTITKEDGTTLSFDLSTAVKNFRQQPLIEVPQESAYKLTLSASTKGLAAEVLITQLDGKNTDGKSTFSSAELTILLTP